MIEGCFACIHMICLVLLVDYSVHHLICFCFVSMTCGVFYLELASSAFLVQWLMLLLYLNRSLT